MKNHSFQKWLAFYQIGASVGATFGAIIIAVGLSQLGFSQELGVISVSLENETDKEAIDQFMHIVREKGNSLFNYGTLLLLGIPAVFVWLIYQEKEKTRSLKIKKNPILFDEMYDGKDIELKKRGYDAYSVKKIRFTGESLQYDYSVLKYVEENKMILITEDPENYGGCIENELPCIKLGQNPSIDEIVKEIEILKKSDSKKK